MVILLLLTQSLMNKHSRLSSRLELGKAKVLSKFLTKQQLIKKRKLRTMLKETTLTPILKIKTKGKMLINSIIS